MDWTLLLITMLSGSAGALLTGIFRWRKETKEAFLQEIRNVNRALALIYNITERGLAFKSQHVGRLTAEFDQERKAYLDALENGREYRPHLNFMQLVPPSTPIKEAMHVILEKTQATGRAIHTLTALSTSLEGLEAVIAARNEFIRETLQNPDRIGINRVFAISTSGRVEDARYVSFMAGLSKLNDDVIFYSLTLGDQMYAYGQELSEEYKGCYFCEEPPRLNTVDYGDRESHPLIPNAELYQDWMDKHRVFPKPLTCWGKIRSKLPFISAAK
jgi:hypothetical protein